MKIQFPIIYRGPVVSLFQALNAQSSNIYAPCTGAAHYTKLAIAEVMAKCGIPVRTWTMSEDTTPFDPASDEISFRLIVDGIDLNGAKAIEQRVGDISNEVFSYVLRQFVTTRTYDTLEDVSKAFKVLDRRGTDCWAAMTVLNQIVIGCFDDLSNSAANVFVSMLNDTGCLPAGRRAVVGRYKSAFRMAEEIDKNGPPSSYGTPRASVSPIQFTKYESPISSSTDLVQFPTFPVFNPRTDPFGRDAARGGALLHRRLPGGLAAVRRFDAGVQAGPQRPLVLSGAERFGHGRSAPGPQSQIASSRRFSSLVNSLWYLGANRSLKTVPREYRWGARATTN